MTRVINRLPSSIVEKPSDEYRQPGRHADGNNLYLSVAPTGARRWIFLYRWRGRQVEMGLGTAQPGHVSLKEARQLAVDAHALLRKDISPLEHRRSQNAAVPTFKQFFDSFFPDFAKGLKNPKHIQQWPSSLSRYASSLFHLPINEIGTEHVLQVLRPIWTTKAESASRLRGRVERILNAATAKGLRTGDNPARWQGHLDQLLPKAQKLTRGHHAALPASDLPAFVAELRAREGASARALEFLILTATRSAETRLATWSEFDLENRLWCIPGARTKTGRLHRVPLSARACELLEQQKKFGGDFVFWTASPKKPLSETAFRMLLKRMGHDEITTHGFRSTFRDWGSERAEAPNEVMEMALAHTIKSDAEAAYRRGDLLERRRTLMTVWADFCTGADLEEALAAARVAEFA